MVFLLIIILLGTFSTGCDNSSSSNPSSNDATEAIYKPMVNIDGVVYILTKDYIVVNESKLQKIGVVEKSLNSPEKYIKTTDDSGTSNVYKVGTEIFTLDGQVGIVVVSVHNKADLIYPSLTFF